MNISSLPWEGEILDSITLAIVLVLLSEKLPQK